MATRTLQGRVAIWRPGRCKAGSPYGDQTLPAQVTIWLPEPVMSLSPYGDRELTSPGPHMVTEMQLPRRHMATPFCSLSSLDQNAFRFVLIEISDEILRRKQATQLLVATQLLGLEIQLTGRHIQLSGCHMATPFCSQLIGRHIQLSAHRTVFRESIYNN
ncbi:hypothetical protein YC2023_002658 [Brassica napus]